MALIKPSRSATPSIDYPGPRVVAGSLSPDDPDDHAGMLDFECEYCRETFYVLFADYHGEWDHEPNVPVCPECSDD